MLRVENISKTFEKIKVLDKVTFEVEENSFFCLLGPTGHGKTTLLRIIAGVETPDEGRIYYNNEDITDLPPQKRPISLVFQDYALYRNLNVYENIASPLRVKKLSPEVIDKKVKDVSELLNIKHLLERRVTELSGGEMQRVSIGRALAKEPKILLMDEPLTNLDYKLRERMRTELKTLKLGTVLYATTSSREALAMATHIGVILNGQILQYGRSEEVYRAPKNVTVAKYLYEPPMNLIEAEIVERNGKYFSKVSEEFMLDLSSHMKELVGNKKLFLGIHPHDLKNSRETEDMLPITSKIELVEYQGSETLVHLRYENAKIVKISPGIETYEEDEEIVFFISPRKIHIFDESGRFIGHYTR